MKPPKIHNKNFQNNETYWRKKFWHENALEIDSMELRSIVLKLSWIRIGTKANFYQDIKEGNFHSNPLSNHQHNFSTQINATQKDHLKTTGLKSIKIHLYETEYNEENVT